MEARHRDSDSSTLALAPVAVVSPMFCALRTVQMTVTKMGMSFSGGDFTVTDANGGVMLRVEGICCSYPKRRVLHDAAGRPILTMQRKVFSMHNEWKVFRGDSTNSRDLLFAVKKATIFQLLKTDMNVFLARNTAEQVCDFKIKGINYFDRSCTFYRGNSSTMIAQMKHKFTISNLLLGEDTYNVTVFPHVDYVFVAAIVVILDEIHRERSK